MPFSHMSHTYRRFDDRGFGVRFYPDELPLINLQILDGRAINTKTREDLGRYDAVKREITIERELRLSISSTKGGKQ